jgi:hypothetical protein
MPVQKRNTMSRLPTVTSAALAGLATLVLAMSLTGCGGAAGADDDHTTHALGETVDVPFYPLDYATGTEQTGEGRVTVTAVRAGSSDDLVAAGFTLDPEEESATPYYVDVTYENTGATAVEPREPNGVDAEGELISSLTIIDFGGPAFERCPGVPERVAPGANATGCSIVLVPEGAELEEVAYLAGASEPFVYWEARP